MRLVSLIASLMLTLFTGCSHMFVKGPPVGHEQMPYFDCTDSKFFPAVDTIIAIGDILQAVVVAATANGTNDPALEQAGPTIVGSVLGAILFSTSAISGSRKVDACRAAKARFGAIPARQIPEDDASMDTPPGSTPAGSTLADGASLDAVRPKPALPAASPGPASPAAAAPTPAEPAEPPGMATTPGVPPDATPSPDPPSGDSHGHFPQ